MCYIKTIIEVIHFCFLDCEMDSNVYWVKQLRYAVYIQNSLLNFLMDICTNNMQPSQPSFNLFSNSSLLHFIIFEIVIIINVFNYVFPVNKLNHEIKIYCILTCLKQFIYMVFFLKNKTLKHKIMLCSETRNRLTF